MQVGQQIEKEVARKIIAVFFFVIHRSHYSIVVNAKCSRETLSNFVQVEGVAIVDVDFELDEHAVHFLGELPPNRQESESSNK